MTTARRPSVACAALLALCLGGCATAIQERADEYNQDGLELFEQGEYVLARESFKAALALKPQDPGLLCNVGRCYDRVGKSAQAEQFYNACLQRSPNHTSCRHALAVMLVRDKRPDDAARMIAGWIAAEPQLAAAYAEDGWYWHQAGDLPRAQSRLQQALQIDPHDPRALVEMGQVYESMSRPDRALVLYERALERDPHQEDVTERINLLLAKGAKRPQPD